ncbi:uncharacterized protein LOC143235415 [Tachypleus tridentatus]|uniref:uncharacterized protein LOC143235415 n=1 Tax=Tachypleus tridentatus TaxID=6853 RepID=UPI003FD4C528
MKFVLLFLIGSGFVGITHPRVLIPRVNYENSVKISKEESHDYIVKILELLITTFDNKLTSQGKFSFLTMKQTLHHLSNLEETLAKVLVLSEKITSSLEANRSGSSSPYTCHFDEALLYLESLVTKLQDVTSILQDKEASRDVDSATTRVVLDQMRKMEERLLHAESKGRRRLLSDLMIKMQDVETRIIGLKNSKPNPAMEFLLSRMQQIELEVREQNQWLNSIPYSQHRYNNLNPLQLTENSILYQLEEMQNQLNDIFLVLKDLKSERPLQKKTGLR